MQTNKSYEWLIHDWIIKKKSLYTHAFICREGKRSEIMDNHSEFHKTEQLTFSFIKDNISWTYKVVQVKEVH